MESIVKDMDFLIKHWGSYPRHFPSPFPLGTINSIPRKRDWVRTAFQSCNFSLILSGRGKYHRNGRLWPVEAPCVITQWPGEYVEYGPPAGGTWDEIYLIYDAGLFTEFQKHRLIDISRPVWPIANPPAVESHLAELLTLSAGRDPEQAVDRVDRICERVILETQLRPPEPVDDSDESATIQRIIRELAGNLDQEIDLDQLAARYGLSPATFRRRWAQVMATPPARYRLQLRLREACRQLVETTRPIYEIANAVGFEDELYFSRRFHQELKVAPRNYRRMYQIQRSFATNG